MKTIQTMTAAILFISLGMAVGGEASAAVHCHDVVVYKERPVRDHDRVAGTVIGAVAGGVIGHQFGGGSGKTLATVGGAAAGGYIGNHVQKEHQHRRYRTVQRVCTHD
jgi:uncharacterized protein YcfJ